MTRLAKGQDGVLELIVFTAHNILPNREFEFVSIKTAAPAVGGATSVAIDRLKYTLSDGDMLMFPGNMVAVVNGLHEPGATLLNVESLPGNVQNGETAKKLQDLTGYELMLEVLTAQADAVPNISKSGTNQNQGTSDGRGRCHFAFVAADTSSLTSRRYAADAWRRNTGSARPVGSYNIELYDAGFQ